MNFLQIIHNKQRASLLVKHKQIILINLTKHGCTFQVDANSHTIYLHTNDVN